GEVRRRQEDAGHGASILAQFGTRAEPVLREVVVVSALDSTVALAPVMRAVCGRTTLYSGTSSPSAARTRSASVPSVSDSSPAPPAAIASHSCGLMRPMKTLGC